LALFSIAFIEISDFLPFSFFYPLFLLGIKFDYENAVSKIAVAVIGLGLFIEPYLACYISLYSDGSV